MKHAVATITPAFIRAVRERLREGRPVQRRLPMGGRLALDRRLPFLFVYRRPPAQRDRGTARLVTTQAAYLLAPGDADFREDLQALLAGLAEEMGDAFEQFLIVEVWSTRRKGEGEEHEPMTLRPAFRLVAPEGAALENTVETLALALKKIALHKQTAEIDFACTAAPAPPDLPPLLPADVLAATGGHVLGVEVHPFFRDAKNGEVFPFLFDALRRQVDTALRQALFTFSRQRTAYEPSQFCALGRSRLGKVAREVDHRLAQMDESFQFLLQMTPLNTRQAWRQFREDGHAFEPVFYYRPLNVDPGLLKRELFDLPVEKVEDPLLAQLFREKQEELDRKLTMLQDRDTRQFFFGSLQLYGEVEPDLLELSEEILRCLSPEHDDAYTNGESLGDRAFAEVAEEEFEHYRPDCPAFPETAHLRTDMPPGLMVSQGELLIGRGTTTPLNRVDALLQHEVGTHMVTYFNGQAQPLQILRTGLAGYEALQEGLAVLAEFLVDGLTMTRLRVLAGRVVAAHCLIEGASFVEVFRMLRDHHAFGPETAWTMTMRTFRGGGLIKDVIYLRGLKELQAYLKDGGDLEPLYVGKIALHHVEAVRELEARGVLRPMPLRPRCLDYPQMPRHLERVRSGLTFVDLLEKHLA